MRAARPPPFEWVGWGWETRIHNVTINTLYLMRRNGLKNSETTIHTAKKATFPSVAFSLSGEAPQYLYVQPPFERQTKRECNWSETGVYRSGDGRGTGGNGRASLGDGGRDARKGDGKL